MGGQPSKSTPSSSASASKPRPGPAAAAASHVPPPPPPSPMDKKRMAQEKREMKAEAKQDIQECIQTATATRLQDVTQLQSIALHSPDSMDTNTALFVIQTTQVAQTQLNRGGDAFTKPDYEAIIMALDPTTMLSELHGWTCEELRSIIRSKIYNVKRYLQPTMASTAPSLPTASVPALPPLLLPSPDNDDEKTNDEEDDEEEEETKDMDKDKNKDKSKSKSKKDRDKSKKDRDKDKDLEHPLAMVSVPSLQRKGNPRALEEGGSSSSTFVSLLRRADNTVNKGGLQGTVGSLSGFQKEEGPRDSALSTFVPPTFYTVPSSSSQAASAYQRRQRLFE